MKTIAAILVAAAAFADRAYSRTIQQNAPLIGVVSLAPIDTTAETDSLAFVYDEQFASSSAVDEASLISFLEMDGKVTVVGPVEVGQLMCDSLPLAENADFLSFASTSNTIVTAEKLHYDVANGDVFTDGIGRKVWTGTVIDPVEGEDASFPWTVIMSWGEECDAETFVTEISKRNIDGTASIIRTIPCGASRTQICLAEILVELSSSVDESEETQIVTSDTGRVSTTTTNYISGTDSSSSADKRLRGSSTIPTISDQGHSTDTVIDVMVLYSREALASLSPGNVSAMESILYGRIADTNDAFLNSKIPLSFNTVHIRKLPYEQKLANFTTILRDLATSEEVAALRDKYGADLVQMIGVPQNDKCGLGLPYSNGDDKFAFSVVNPRCLENHSDTHEFGHNMGCYHQRNKTDSVSTEYSHGFRYCNGSDRYTTIMSYGCENSTRSNYFSNPHVTHLGKPTGTATEDNARTIVDNMDIISNYRVSVAPNISSSTAQPTTAPVVTSSSTVAPAGATFSPLTELQASLAPTKALLNTPFPTPTPPTASPTTDASPPLVIAPPFFSPGVTQSPTANSPPSTFLTLNPVVTAFPTAASLPTPSPTMADIATALPSIEYVRIPFPTTSFPSTASTSTDASIGFPTPETKISAYPTVAPFSTPSPTSARPLTTTFPDSSPLQSASPTTTTVNTDSLSTDFSPTTYPSAASAPTAHPTSYFSTTPYPTLDYPTVVSSVESAPTAPTNPPVAPTVQTIPPVAPTAPTTPPVAPTVPTTAPVAPTASATSSPTRSSLGTKSRTSARRAVSSFSSATGSLATAAPTVDPRSSQSSANASTAFVYMGCYGNEDPPDSVLSGEYDLNFDDGGLTTEACAAFCEGSAYFGTEYGRECFCGASTDDPTKLGVAVCDSQCSGNATETCGGSDAVSVYEYLTEGWGVVAAEYKGCWADDKQWRIMERWLTYSGMTNNLCETLCGEYPFFGTQYGTECWCGDASTNYTSHGVSTACNFECAGDANQICGGYDTLSVWQY